MDFSEVHKKIVRNVAIELTDEFDRNFERKAFFTEAWPATRFINPSGSMLMRSGNLRRSIAYNISGDNIAYTSSQPYATIHNEGGVILVTEKMRRFFWAMYKQSTGTIQQQWKSLALKQLGSSIKIEKRQFIGQHAQVDKAIQDVINDEMTALGGYFATLLRP